MMNMKKFVFSGMLAAAAAFMTGCDPDKFGITIPVSAINKAVAGEVGYAKVKAYYTTSQDDVKLKFPQIKSVLQNHLGDKAKIDMAIPPEGDASLTVIWKIPVVDKSRMTKVKGNPVLGLVLEGSWLSFTPLAGLDALNADLKQIDFTVEATFMSDMEMTVNNDTETDYAFTVCGAFVEEQPYVYNTVKLESEDSTTVTFKRASEDSVFHYKNPCLSVCRK